MLLYSLHTAMGCVGGKEEKGQTGLASRAGGQSCKVSAPFHEIE